jgi:hypothetical protein
MSALNFNLTEEIVSIATDTLALSGESHKPHHFQSKFFIVPHLSGVICGTGVGEFIANWAHEIQVSMLVKSISHLDEFAPERLRILFHEMDLPHEVTSSVIHIGYDYEMGKFRGFAYQSINNFDSSELKYGFYIRPNVQNFQQTDDLFDDFKRIIAIQREEDIAKPIDQRIGIGGEVLILTMGPERFILDRSYKFEDYDKLYEQMCDELPPNKSE